MAATTSLLLGEKPTFRGTFRDEDGDLADPTVVQFKFKAPDETIITKTYGVDIDVIHDGLGIFSIAYEPLQTGAWCWGAQCDDPFKTVSDGHFTVTAPCFVDA